MSFLAPWGFLALLAVPVIVVLHLVRLQRRRVRLPALELWQRIQPQPLQRTRRLPWTPLLLLHVLAAACLGLALTQPLLRGSLAGAPTHTIVLLDTTTSMGAVDTTLSRFERVRRELERTISDLERSDTLVLISLDARPQILASGSGADSRQLLAMLARLRPAGNGSNLERAMGLANASLAASYQNQIVVYSDTAFTTTAPLTAAAPLDWQLIGGPVGNQAITAFAALRLPDGTAALYARIFNASSQPVNRTARLLVDGQPQDQAVLALPANGSVEQTWRLPAGADRAELILAGGDALAADDQATAVLRRNQRQRVRLISAMPTAVERVLAALPDLDVSVAARFSVQADPVAVTVLNGVLPATLPAGALLLINPPPDDPRLAVTWASGGSRASSAVIDSDFALADLSSVQWGERRMLEAGVPPDGLKPIISDVSGAPLVLGGALEGHAAVIWMFEVDSSNLPAKLAFPLLMAATINRLTTGGLPASLPPGSFTPATALLAPNGSPAGARLDQPGWYALVDNSQAGVVVNFGDPAEALLTPLTPPTIASDPAELPNAGPPEVQPRGLWPWLAALALGIIAVEWWYINGQPAPRTWLKRLRGAASR